MIQNILRTFGGIEAYGTVSLCLFFLVFAASVVWACAQKRTYLERMAQLPLETGTDNSHSAHE